MRLLPRVTIAALLALAPLSAGATASWAAPEPTPAPLFTATDAVPGTYIVILDAGTDPAKLAASLGLEPAFLYTSAVNGFAVPLTPGQLATVRASPGVKSVEEDARVAAPPQPATPPGSRAPAASWGLDRIDQRAWDAGNGVGDGQFTTAGHGAGVTAYILDTGIEYAHEEFGGRAVFGFDAVGDGREGGDCNGHGTHVAGTVGGRTYGVANEAALVSVRVLDCEGRGTYSALIAGFDWVASNARQPAVLNGSLGGDRSAALNEAANALADAGVLPVVAAGNEAQDACRVSPASAARVVTVAASDRGDEQAAFSNWGPCVSLYAPGQEIPSARLGGGIVTLDGTSMAAPHVTGVAALYKEAHPGARPAEIDTWLRQEATRDVLSRVGRGTPNRLLFTGGL
ncbi:S8 family peptidase [Streptomyces sp. NPDC101733]|uniref:S8 family peptidase n=1 Tax=unclassified Streptomyces TaxID=2593676 RepID=UPI0037FAC6A1